MLAVFDEASVNQKKLTRGLCIRARLFDLGLPVRAKFTQLLNSPLADEAPHVFFPRAV